MQTNRFSEKITKCEPLTADDLAYIMYTSGSTGNPKGVMITHRGVVRLVKNNNYMQINPEDCLSQAVSISFDASVFEIWGALLNGAKLVFADNSIITNVEGFANFLKKEKINVLTLVSAVFDQLASVKPEMFSNLKYLYLGGDVLNVDTVQKVINCHEGSPQYILNGYGPTENTNCTTIYNIPKNFERNKPIPIGKPISNTTVYVLDKYMNLMPVGIPGELCTGGDGLATGYFNRKDLTDERFVDIDLDNKIFNIYKIGDLARWLPDGNLDYICRIDNQVKVRGFRIELDTIELCLLNSKLVKQCAVIVRQDEKMRKTLIAYVVFKKRKGISLLRTFLSKRLPYYMLPNLFVVLESLPQLPSGKIDKKELFLRFQSISYKSPNYVAPKNKLENTLADIWKELLNLNIVGTKDNFFDLGGHSLLMTEMIVKIKEQFNIEIASPAFLESPTIDNLSKLIEQPNIESINNSSNTWNQFKSDIFLNPKIKPISNSNSAKNQNTVLLTGVTGFLGIHLLNDLYKLQNTTIYCLIRGNNIDDATDKLKRTIKKYWIDNLLNFDTKRIVIVFGDLSKPKLGIEQSLFDKLSDDVDVIYHCGASVHHIYSYEMLRKTNVLSTLEIVKFSVNKKNKHIHYISTQSVVAACSVSFDVINEDFIEENDIKINNLSGYAQTKLASEIILSKAHKRGIHVSIYRPSWIIGAANDKFYFLENNHLLLLIKGCMQMKHAPKLNAQLNLISVDFISDFITKVSNNAEIKSYVFNLISPHVITWSNVIDKLNQQGYDIDLVSANKWKQSYLSKIDEGNVAYPLMSLYSDGGIGWANAQNELLKSPSLNYSTACKQLKLECPKIENTFLKSCLRFFSDNDFMQHIV